MESDRKKWPVLTLLATIDTTYRKNDHSGKVVTHSEGNIIGGIVHGLHKAGQGHVPHHVSAERGVVYGPYGIICHNSNVRDICHKEKGTEHVGYFKGQHHHSSSLFVVIPCCYSLLLFVVVWFDVKIVMCFILVHSGSLRIPTDKNFIAYDR
jgi:hypothetical protein